MASGDESAGDSLGLVNLDKPAGWSSAKAVTAIRWALGGRRRTGPKVGHAGTLDPTATGVLVLLVGRATRLAELLMDAGKEYLAEVRLGATSPTDDTEGRIADCGSRIGDHGLPSETAVREALGRFRGRIEQRPPAFSAVHVNGKRAYKLAKRGEPVEPAARPVVIHAIELLGYAWPTLRLRVDCGRGTYIRSLARDLGEALGVGGYLASLTRTRVGPFRLEDALPPDRCRSENVADWLLPVESVVPALPRVNLTEKQAELLGHGAALDATRVVDLETLRPGRGDSTGTEGAPAGPMAAFDPAGRLVALCRLTGDAFSPTVVLRPRWT